MPFASTKSPGILKGNMHQRHAAVICVGLFLLVGVGMLLGGYAHTHHGPGGAWSGRVFGGTITHVGPSEISVADIHGTEKTFLMTSSTLLRKGKEAVGSETLFVGAFVMVTIYPAPEGGEVAREVRLLSATMRSSRELTTSP